MLALERVTVKTKSPSTRGGYASRRSALAPRSHSQLSEDDGASNSTNGLGRSVPPPRAALFA
eukprot:6336877-Lingulodinium_polyedra.AAC.1